MAKGANEVLSLLVTIVQPALESAVAALPDMADVVDKVVPSRKKKKRVAATKDEKKKATEEEEEEDPELPSLRVMR